MQHNPNPSRLRRSSPLVTRRSKQGATVVELLTVLLLLSLIFTVLIGIVAQSSAMVSQGVQIISLNQKARFTVQKMAPFLLTAIGDDNNFALVAPAERLDAPTAADLLAYRSIQFLTTEDFFDPAYDPKAAWNPLNTQRFYYEIYFDQTNPDVYTLDDGSTINLGKVLMRRHLNATFTAVDTTYDPQVIGFNVQQFYCHRLPGNSLEVIVHTVGKRKGPAGNNIDMFEQAIGILNIPTSTY